jgi:hypothetical protein
VAAIANFISLSDTRQECLSVLEAASGNSNRKCLKKIRKVGTDQNMLG